MISAELLADTIAEAVHRATAPLLTKIALLEARPVVAPETLELLKWQADDLRTRMAGLEARAPVPGPPGPPGPVGLPGDRGERGETGPVGPAGIGEKGDRGEMGAAGAVGPIGPVGERGEQGEMGLAGKDGAPGDRGERGEMGLAGKDGTPGERGERGEKGLDGTSVDMAVVEQSIATLVTKAVATIPRAKDGRDGQPGRDGLGLTSAVIDRDGALVLTLSDGSTKNVGMVMGKDGRDGLHGKDIDMSAVERQIQQAVDAIPKPADGKDGADGLGFDDADLTFDESSGWQLRLAQGARVKTFAIPIPWDAGVWQAGRTYPKGAGVTRQGAFWIAQSETSARPGDESAESRAWRLSVKGGKDGKPGPPGRDGGTS